MVKIGCTNQVEVSATAHRRDLVAVALASIGLVEAVETSAVAKVLARDHRVRSLVFHDAAAWKKS